MYKLRILTSLFVVVALGLGTFAAFGGPKGSNESIRIVERPGYFETHGTIYNRAPGPVVFEVENKSGKDAGFVLSRPGSDPLVIGVKNGESGRLEANLQPGTYEYFCPIIPTAKYSFTVK